MGYRIGRMLLLLAAGATLGLAAPAAAQTIELKVSHFLPPNHTFQKAMVGWGEELEKASSGRLKLRIYPAGQLAARANRQFDAARNGISDVAISLHGATPGRYAITELVASPSPHRSPIPPARSCPSGSPSWRRPIWRRSMRA